MQKIEWYEGGLQLADIATKNVGENYLNTRMKYIMVRIEKLIDNTCTIWVRSYRIVSQNIWYNKL